MIQRIEEFILKHNINLKGAGVIAGYSGGPDSTLLMHFLLHMRSKYGIFISVMHLNHMERESANKEEEFVSNFCIENQIPVRLCRYDILNDPLIKEMGFEMLAREKRIEYFNEELENNGADYILTGHNADDRIETMLLNMERGTGPEGLCSMKPVNGNMIKPMLFLTREEIRKYLDKENIKYIEDETNNDISFGRNRIRHGLMPALKETLRNGYSGILRTLDNIEEHTAFNQTGFVLLYDHIANEDGDNIILDISRLMSYNKPTVRVFLLFLMRELGIVSSAPLEEILKMLESEKKTFSLNASGYVFRKCYDKIEISDAEQPKAELTAITLEKGKTAEFGDFTFRMEEGTFAEGKDAEFICLPQTGFASLRIRTRIAGDRFLPFGMNEQIKLKKFFINEKIPADIRDSIPLLVNERDEILWIAGHRRTGLYPVKEKECIIVRVKETQHSVQ